jgi:DNA polymerase III sliding clamp (beta) subunit (PCNA family)
MEIRIEKLKLKKLLDKVQSVIPAKAIYPAEEFLRIDITEKYIAVSAANTNVQCSVKDSFQHYEHFFFCVNGNDFIKAIKKIKAKEIRINVEDVCTLSFNKTQVQIPLVDSDDFIKPNTSMELKYNSVQAESLIEGIRSSLPFVVSEKGNHPLRDLWFNFNETNLDIYATDRWIFNIFNTFCSGDNAHISITPEFAKSIQLMFDDLQDASIAVEISERNITFKTQDRRITVALSVYKAFNYMSVIPSTETYIDVKKDDLMEVLPLAEDFSTNSRIGADVVLKSDGRKLLISGSDNEYKTSIISEAEISEGDAEFEIRLSVKLLSTVVNTTIDEVIRLYADAPNKPVLIKEFDRTMLIMPKIG